MGEIKRQATAKIIPSILSYYCLNGGKMRGPLPASLGEQSISASSVERVRGGREEEDILYVKKGKQIGGIRRNGALSLGHGARYMYSCSFQ